MAEGKKGFLLYADQISIVKKLIEKDRKDGTNYSGELFYHLFQYVNDEDPEAINFIIEMAFEPIKLQLKRDLRKYEAKSDENSEKGLVGNLKRWNRDLYDKFIQKEIDLPKALEIAECRSSDKQRQKTSLSVAKIADNGKGNDNDKEKKNNIDTRKQTFSDTLKPFLEKYGKDMLNEFYKYWVEPNKSKTKFRQELERTWDITRRLETWSKNDKNFTKSTDKNEVQSTGPKYEKLT